MGVRLTRRGRWLLVYLPAFLLLEVTAIMGGCLLWGPEVFNP